MVTIKNKNRKGSGRSWYLSTFVVCLGRSFVVLLGLWFVVCLGRRMFVVCLGRWCVSVVRGVSRSLVVVVVCHGRSFVVSLGRLWFVVCHGLWFVVFLCVRGVFWSVGRGVSLLLQYLQQYSFVSISRQQLERAYYYCFVSFNELQPTSCRRVDLQ